MTNKGLKKKLGAVISQAAAKLKATESKRKKKKSKSKSGLKVNVAKVASAVPAPDFTSLPKELRDLYTKHRANRKSGIQDSTIVSEFSESAQAYAWALKVPEFLLPVKVPDNKMAASVVVCSEYEIDVPIVTDSVSGLKYAGVAIRGGLVAKSNLLSASASGVLTWATGVDDPMRSTIAANMDDFRPVAVAVHLFNASPILNLEGEVDTMRFLEANNGFSSGNAFPSSVPAITNTRMTETFPWSDETRIARLTAIPVDTEDQSFVSTAAGNDNLTVSLFLARLSATASAQNFKARIYSTYECTPYQATMNLFPVSADMGDPTKIAIAVAEAAGFLLQSGNTMNGLAKALGGADVMSLLNRGKQLYGLLSNLFISGFSAVFGEERRALALIGNARDILRSSTSPLRDDRRTSSVLASLDRSYSDLIQALSDLHVIGSLPPDTVMEEKLDTRTSGEALLSPINSQESMGESLLRDHASLLARSIPAPKLIRNPVGRP